MKDRRYTSFLIPRDLFLVTGTYMTGNWEASAFQTDSKSVKDDVSVQAVAMGDDQLSIDWNTCSTTNRGDRMGHTHLGQAANMANTGHSFEACCHCEKQSQDQCIFLRGWQVREAHSFPKHVLAVPISVEGARNIDWRRAQFSSRPEKSSTGIRGFFKKLSCSDITDLNSEEEYAVDSDLVSDIFTILM